MILSAVASLSDISILLGCLLLHAVIDKARDGKKWGEPETIYIFFPQYGKMLIDSRVWIFPQDHKIGRISLKHKMDTSLERAFSK
jgi:hypothetical protein